MKRSMSTAVSPGISDGLVIDTIGAAMAHWAPRKMNIQPASNNNNGYLMSFSSSVQVIYDGFE